MAFYWNEDKNNQLKNERAISFERIVVAIEEGHLDLVAKIPKGYQTKETDWVKPAGKELW